MRNLILLPFICILWLSACNQEQKNVNTEIEEESIQIEETNSNTVVKTSISEEKKTEHTTDTTAEETHNNIQKTIDKTGNTQKSSVVINKTSVKKDNKTIEYHQSFNKKNENGEYLSEPLDLDLSNASSGMLSAYCLYKSDYKLYFRVFKKDVWLAWEELPENTDVNNPNRKVFAPKQLDPTIWAIQFKSNQATEQEVVFRIFTFAKD